jgi:hypothetical protein
MGPLMSMSSNRFIEDSTAPPVSFDSIQDTLKNFRAFLTKRDKRMAATILDENPTLGHWLSSQRINLGTDLEPCIHTIPFEDLQDYFKAILASHVAHIFKRFWEGNILLRNYYQGQEVNFGTEESPDIQRISLSKLKEDFKAVLNCNIPYIINAFWNNSPLLQECYSGQKVNLATDQQQNQQIIPFVELGDNFNHALFSRSPPMIRAIWEKNLSLRTYFSSISDLKKLDDWFKLVLSSQCSYIIMAFWGNSPFLQSYYANEMQTIFLDERLVNFKAVLASHCLPLIRILQEKNPLLWKEFCGREVGVPANHKELIDNFKLVLNTLLQEIICDMWRDNLALYDAIWSLSRDDSKILLERVMNSTKAVNSSFISVYLNWFKQDEIIKEVLHEMQNQKSSSKLKENKIFLLENYSSKKSILPEPKKRKTSDQAESNKTKKQKLSDVELHDILIKLPENLQKDGKCRVPYSVGEELKKLSLLIKKEMGILSVKKTKTKSKNFEVCLHPTDYYAARKKYLIPIGKIDIDNDNTLDSIFAETAENIYKSSSPLLFFNSTAEEPFNELYPLSPRLSPTRQEDD